MIKTFFHLIMTIAFGYSLFWIYDTYYLRVSEQIDAPLTNADLPNVTVSQIQLQSLNLDGSIKFRLFGKVAELNEKTRITKTVPINLIIYDDKEINKQQITILAREGYHHRTVPEYFELIGDVECNIAGEKDLEKKSNGFNYLKKIFTEKLLYYPKLDKFISPGKVKIIDTNKNMVATGDSFTYYQKEEKGEIEGSVVIRLHEDPKVVLAEMNRELQYDF